MDKTSFLTIYCSFEQIDVVKLTLPGIIEETKRNDFFLLLSSNLSMAHARNMCLQLGQELYAPDYICMLEDDHGYKEGIIIELTKACTVIEVRPRACTW